MTAIRTPNIQHDRLISVLSYDPETGIFKWIQRTGRRAKVGSVAGNLSNAGYIRIFIDGQNYQAHRLAFFYMTKRWPSRFIDHRNTNRSDNSWANLREATDEINLQNQVSAKTNSSTGLLGVVPIKNKFIARIKVRGKQIHLGTFDAPEQAHQAYLNAKRKLHQGCTI